MMRNCIERFCHAMKKPERNNVEVSSVTIKMKGKRYPQVSSPIRNQRKLQCFFNK